MYVSFTQGQKWHQVYANNTFLTSTGGVAFGNNIFLYDKTLDRYSVSKDGNTWQDYYWSFYRSTFGEVLYVQNAFFYLGLTDVGVYRSEDAVNWHPIKFSEVITSIQWLADQSSFVATGMSNSLYFSSNGKDSWNLETTVTEATVSLTYVASTNGIIVAAGGSYDNEIFASSA